MFLLLLLLLLVVVVVVVHDCGYKCGTISCTDGTRRLLLLFGGILVLESFVPRSHDDMMLPSCNHTYSFLESWVRSRFERSAADAIIHNGASLFSSSPSKRRQNETQDSTNNENNKVRGKPYFVGVGVLLGVTDSYHSYLYSLCLCLCITP